MIRVVALLLAAGLAACGSNATGQPSDLAGTWNLQPGDDIGDARAFCGLTCTIRHETQTIIVELNGGQVRYAIDGSESRRTSRMGGIAVEIVRSAAWGTGKLFITEKARTLNGEPRTSQQTLEVTRRGDELLVEGTSIAPDRQPRIAHATYALAH